METASGAGHGRTGARPDRLIWGSPIIIDTVGEAAEAGELGELEVQVSAASFLQVNPVQTDLLYRQALAMADIGPDDIVFDLYCGIGALSLLAAIRARAVYGVESAATATADAAANARRNRIDNARFITGRAENAVPLLIEEGGIRPNVVLLDPPRSGCEADVLLALAAAQVARIVYVSCNPATLARDLRILADHGYVLGDVAPVDMFPQTAHVECCISTYRVD